MRGVEALVAYLVLSPRSNVLNENMIEFLNERLPQYMIPTLFETISSLPLLPSGKVDRKNLPIPNVHHDVIKDDYVPPRTDL